MLQAHFVCFEFVGYAFCDFVACPHRSPARPIEAWMPKQGLECWALGFRMFREREGLGCRLLEFGF